MRGNICMIVDFSRPYYIARRINEQMRLAGVSDNIFDTLMSDEDRIVFNLFELIKENSRAFIATDDSTYIFAENSRRAPTWLYLREKPEGKTFDELVTLVSGMVRLNALFKMNCREELARELLDAVSNATGVRYAPEITMEVYSCQRLIPQENIEGKMIAPREEHREILKEFVVGMVRDSAGLVFGADDSEKFTSALLSSQHVFLWENSEGKIVSMAKIAHKTAKQARLNAIFTDTEKRGKDYTKMLLSCLTESLLAENVIPLIYTDKKDTNKNEAFRKLGYQKVGDITQFAFHQ